MSINHPFSEFVASSDYWAWETDSELCNIYISPNFESLSGLPVTVALGASRLDMLARVAHEFDWSDHRQDLMDRKAFRAFRCPVADQRGVVRWVESSGTPRFDESGTFLGYRGMSRDMTDDLRSSKRLELADSQLRISETMFHQIERIAKIGAWKFETRTGTLEWSDEIFRIYDMEPGSQLDLEIAMAPYSQQARDELQNALALTTTMGTAFDIVLPFATATQSFRWVRVLGDAEIVAGRTVKLFGTIQDVTDEREHQNEVRRLAETDHLTGIANRAAFQTLANNAIQTTSENDTIGALCLIDLDQFKQTNDHFGHAAGDAVLQETSAWLQSLAGASATVSRLGGDEFAMIITGFESEDALEDNVHERFATLCHQVEFQSRILDIRVSVGYVVFSQSDCDLEGLMANADLALYDAKSRGRRKITKYRNSFGSQFARKMELISEFKVALERGEIIPHYQPIVELGSLRHSGFEALARWNHPHKGILPAGAFSEVFENQELVADIGDVMIKAITEDMGRWKAAGIPFGRIGINVTDANLLEPGFLLSVSGLLGRHNLLPKELVFEITENTVFKSKNSIVETLNNLQTLGVLIALDDFGTGFSSLTHLQDIPFDILKIDKGFVQKLDESPASKAIVQSLVTLGNSLGYSTVAEGIETAYAAETLKTIGCERAQGYYFAKPMAAADVPAHLSATQTVPWSRNKVLGLG